ncbi:hypothetical protein CIK06_15935 [Plantactinospora sp. KBS50]|nr:hypothetical protein CIK06_15935 [Plantactinospora sp. KBS50]
MPGSARDGAAASASANPATVGVAKIWVVVSRRRSVAAMRAATRTARSELPPSTKKSSCTPTRSTPSTSAQVAASRRSSSVRGPR